MWRSTDETPPHQSADCSTVSLRLGHPAALQCPRHCIHYRGAASLPFRGGKGVGLFDLAEEVVVDGITYRVRTDYRVILEIFIMLNDPELSDGDKTEALLRMFYIDRPTDTKAAIQAFADFVEPRKRSGARGPGLVDWENDFDLIVAPVNRI